MLPAILAFCGFYVAGSNQPMFNDATQVVLMRDGTRTVLAMQNNYKGPPEAFAMIVPVPEVLHEGDVKTLPPSVFEHVEQMGAPRLVEYWEHDPCQPVYEAKSVRDGGPLPPASSVQQSAGLGVKIEAQFTVAEYQIVILSAKDSTGLETWLKQQKYNVPEGAEPLLRPYVTGGSKFFVAKVDPTKVKFVDGRAALSPLRFHYDSDRFELPIRLGLTNSAGTQDLIVSIFATQRYEVANYPNATIPTNLDLTEGMKDTFPAFYAALFDRTAALHPGAVITEYVWAAMSCDPCPGPTLTAQELQTLGLDVLPHDQHLGDGLTLTRLHARYGKDIKDDLVFKTASAITGGREVETAEGQLERGAQPANVNNFQGRYAIRHPWSGPLTCNAPIRGRWGGPWAGEHSEGIKPAVGLAFAPRGTVQLASALAHPDSQLAGGPAVAATPAAGSAGPAGSAVMPPTSPPTPRRPSGCGCQAEDRSSAGTAALVLAVGLVASRRRRRS